VGTFASAAVASLFSSDDAGAWAGTLPHVTVQPRAPVSWFHRKAMTNCLRCFMGMGADCILLSRAARTDSMGERPQAMYKEACV
jgi:hypothetical protein